MMFFQNLAKKAGLTVSFVLLSQANVMALDILGQLRRQYNPPYTIPEIIIDDNPTSQPPSPTPTSNPYPTSNLNDPRFTCEFVNGQYTVMYRPESQTARAYPWAIPGRMGGGWTPERRCLEISRRLEAYRPDGLLELKIGIENNYSVLCATTEVDPSCRIVLTVPPNQDPEITRNLVFENLLIADSGSATYGVNTFNSQNSSGIAGQIGKIFNPHFKNNAPVSSSKPINLKPFLDASDGGTGTYLKNQTQKPTIKPSLPRIFNSK